MNSDGSWENVAKTQIVPGDPVGSDFGVGVGVGFSLGLGHTSVLGITLALAIGLGLWIESNWYRRLKNLPPGPKNMFEIMVKFRSMLFLACMDLDLATTVMESEYGKVFGWFSYMARWVAIGDFHTLQLASKNPALNGRPPSEFLQMLDDGVYRGIITTSGETWREIRKFTVSQLKSLGMGKKSRLDPIITEQVDECVSELRAKIGQPFSSEHFFNTPAINILWEIISSQKFGLKDPEPQKLTQCLERMSACWIQALFIGRFPKMGPRLLSLLGIQNPYPDAKLQFKAFASNLLEKRLKSMTDETHDDFAQAFIDKIQATKDVNSPFYGQLGYEHFQEIIRDFFVAGSETTANTLSWALLYLALHPQKQEKLQREIDSVLGQRTPSLDDRPKMKYMEAVINETLRKSSLLPVGLHHSATQDTTIGKFHIPKGTMVSVNAWAIHHCKESWGDPYVFRPERFLNEDETTLIKHDQLVAFGFGKRICPGMALAYEEIFLFTARIFQEFRITWNPAEPKPNMRPRLGATLTPSTHTLIITQRTPQL